MPNELKIKYEYSRDYKKVPATGAWGGLAPNGDVVVNFFVESQTPPDSVTVQVDEVGNVLKETRTMREYSTIREIMVGVVLSPQTVKSIGEFLINYVDNIDKNVNKREDR